MHYYIHVIVLFGLIKQERGTGDNSECESQWKEQTLFFQRDPARAPIILGSS